MGFLLRSTAMWYLLLHPNLTPPLCRIWGEQAPAYLPLS